jgi:hypothetical protein
LVFRDAAGGVSQTQLTLQAGDSIAPLAFPELSFSVSSLLGLDSE